RCRSAFAERPDRRSARRRAAALRTTLGSRRSMRPPRFFGPVPVLLCTLAVLAGLAATDRAEAREAPARLEGLNAGDLRQPLILRGDWRWRAGDDPGWAAPDLDDREWLPLPSTDELRARQPVSWFRRELEVGESASGREVGLYLDLRGAAQLFLDGELLFNFGRLPPPAGARIAGATAGGGGESPLGFGTRYRNFRLPSPGRHTLA